MSHRPASHAFGRRSIPGRVAGALTSAITGPIACAIALSIALSVAAPTTAAPPAPGAASDSPIDLDLYARLLDTHTREVPHLVGTRVDYLALARSQDWKRIVREVEAARPSRLDRAGRLAFWINAYNILTIDLVSKHYPVESIRDIGSFFSPVWNLEVAKIEGRGVSLGEIEHEILRKMSEPRIHAAIVCASTSCPSLARTPYRSSPSRLDADLDRAMRRWLASPEKGISIDRRAGVIRLSKIFDWFEEDFEAGGGVLATISPYLRPDDADWIRAHGGTARIRYFDYDWSLNALK